MKKILYPIFLALFTLMAVSCDNEPLEGEFGDPNGPGGGSSGGSFVATVDGISFVADHTPQGVRMQQRETKRQQLLQQCSDVSLLINVHGWSTA